MIAINGFEFSWPVLTWTLIALVASLLTWINLNDARKDRDAVQKLGGNRMAARVLAADGLIRREQLRILVFMAWFAVGLVAAAVGLDRVQRGTFIVIGLLSTALILLYGSYQDRRDRHHLIKEMAEGDLLAWATQEQIEDKDFGDKRRDLEAKHVSERAMSESDPDRPESPRS